MPRPIRVKLLKSKNKKISWKQTEENTTSPTGGKILHKAEFSSETMETRGKVQHLSSTAK